MLYLMSLIVKEPLVAVSVDTLTIASFLLCLLLLDATMKETPTHIADLLMMKVIFILLVSTMMALKQTFRYYRTLTLLYLVKTDIESGFVLVLFHPSDTHLLYRGFSWTGTCY